MNLLQEISDWAAKLPTWQSDAVRRLFTQETLLASDEDEVLSNLLSANGVVETGIPMVAPVVFSSAHAGAASNKQVVIKELHSVVGVNALVADQSIKFALDGLTIIYGENGAGKSGYTRVLKHSCHAREKSEPLHSNVTAKAQNEPSAIVELSVNGEDIAVHWKKGMAASEHLATIAVFDSHCARVFLDSANEVVYLPYGSDVFGKLGGLFTRLREKVKSRLAAVAQRFPIADEFLHATAAGSFVHSLSSTSDPAQADLLSRMTDPDAARLVELRSLVAAAKVNSPKLQAAELRRTKTRLEQVYERIETLSRELSETASANLKRLCDELSTATKASQLALTIAFSSEPLRGTGEAAWRSLFDSAKLFSMQHAYPESDFPYVEDGALCVLCQEPLKPAAKERILRFQKFVTDDTALRKEQCEIDFKDAYRLISEAKSESLDSDHAVLEEIRVHNDSLATELDKFLTAAQLRKAAIVEACVGGDWSNVPMLAKSPTAEVIKSCETIEHSAIEFDKADKPEALAKLEQELAELADKERLSKYVPDVKAYIAEKKREAGLRDCDRALDTGPITRFGSDVMSRVVTERLETCLTNELDYFSVQSVPLQLKKIGEKGKTKHQLMIESDVRPSGVLSEGEQRVVAIACFLAELAAADHKCAIIFDDPVSSLDHKYRKKVAARLVAEAKQRQVVVFTHDVTMLLSLEAECAVQQARMIPYTVRRSAEGPGACMPPGKKPWHAQSTKERIAEMRQACVPMRKLHASDAIEFERKAKEIYGQLRETWERAIEEVVLNGVVERFSAEVHTRQLRGICIEAADYSLIDQEMSKCSTRFSGHDKAAALILAPPTPDELEADVTTLHTFLKTLRERQKKASEAADELISAPKATLADKRAPSPGIDTERVA